MGALHMEETPTTALEADAHWEGFKSHERSVRSPFLSQAHDVARTLWTPLSGGNLFSS